MLLHVGRSYVTNSLAALLVYTSDAKGVCIGSHCRDEVITSGNTRHGIQEISTPEVLVPRTEVLSLEVVLRYTGIRC